MPPADQTPPQPAAATLTGPAAKNVRRAITFVTFTIAGLVFAFGFGNGVAIGVQLGVPLAIAPLVAPAVDLTVVALLVAMQYLRANGVETRLLGPRLLLMFSSVATLAMNVAHPILLGAYGQAAFYAIAPLLLLGWSEVGPRLLAALHGMKPQPARTVPDTKDAPAHALVERARQLDVEHRLQHGRPITRDRLRTALQVSNATAGQVLREVRHVVAQDA
ncbi:hypothetical protein LWC34_27770 [Kibdelosporangium philippinense]|uniref:DUF2637 domain-containing protein n=1 Tax=Kibdelosporangium philippinense TaxID=211113 RepID=A0ABS8ZFK2_9PSEU|nr:hypothetical protein [Kibdelosporangium philippinense]MCE7006599.1 hypothetical protein [Kibdelosporangium philippinense]